MHTNRATNRSYSASYGVGNSKTLTLSLRTSKPSVLSLGVPTPNWVAICFHEGCNGLAFSNFFEFIFFIFQVYGDCRAIICTLSMLIDSTHMFIKSYRQDMRLTLLKTQPRIVKLATELQSQPSH